MRGGVNVPSKSNSIILEDIYIPLVVGKKKGEDFSSPLTRTDVAYSATSFTAGVLTPSTVVVVPSTLLLTGATGASVVVAVEV